MGPGLGHRVALRLTLEAIITDGCGRPESLLDVAGLQELALLVGVVGPHAGEAVGLKLQAHGEAVCGGLVDLTLLAGDLLVDAEHGLNVVSDLMGEHIGLGEVARGPEAIGQLPVEAQVDVDLLVAGTVERADG